jgi:hypothetical protein
MKNSHGDIFFYNIEHPGKQLIIYYTLCVIDLFSVFFFCRMHSIFSNNECIYELFQ